MASSNVPFSPYSNTIDETFDADLESHQRPLHSFWGQIYSQNGEDGIICEIFRRIGVRDKIFVEIGVETGQQSNTRFLLERGWRGVWIEGSTEKAKIAREIFAPFVESGHLSIVDAFVSAETIAPILKRAGVPTTVDFLSIDIDQNTTHVWRAITTRSRVACVEYNSGLGPSLAIEAEYDPGRVWDNHNWYGGSLKAVEDIGAAKGQHLVGCDLLGINAFLVAMDETAGKFVAPFTALRHYRMPRHHLVNHFGHVPSTVARRWVANE